MLPIFCDLNTMNNLEEIIVEYQKLKNMLTILIGKILIFHHKNKITKPLK